MHIKRYFIAVYFIVYSVTGDSLGQEAHLEPREIRDTEFRTPNSTPLFQLVPDAEDDTKYRFKLVPGSRLIELDLNVKQNDIVLRVNGIAVTDKTRLRNALRKLVKADYLELEILREGSIISVSIPLK